MSSSFNSSPFSVIPREKKSFKQADFVFVLVVCCMRPGWCFFFVVVCFFLVNSNVATLNSMLVYFEHAFQCIDNNMWLHRSLSCIDNCFHHSQVLRMNSAVNSALVSCLMLSLNAFLYVSRSHCIHFALTLAVSLDSKYIFFRLFRQNQNKPAQKKTCLSGYCNTQFFF